LLNADVIGSTHKPDEVIEQFIFSNKSIAETDIPLVRDWQSALSVYDAEMKVPVIFTPNSMYYPTSLTKKSLRTRNSAIMSDYQVEAGRGDHWCCAFARNAAFVECRRHWFYS